MFMRGFGGMWGVDGVRRLGLCDDIFSDGVSGKLTAAFASLIAGYFYLVAADVHAAPAPGSYFAGVQEMNHTGLALAHSGVIDFG